MLNITYCIEILHRCGAAYAAHAGPVSAASA